MAAAEQHRQDALASADETYAHEAAQVDYNHYLTDSTDWENHIGFPGAWYDAEHSPCGEWMGWGCRFPTWGGGNGGFAFAPQNSSSLYSLEPIGPNPFEYSFGTDYSWMWNGWLCDTTSTGVTESCGYLGSYGHGGSAVSDLGQAQDTLRTAREAAEVAYARELGDAKIAYATDVGNADIGLATEKGLAAIQYESGLAQAANDGDTTVLEQAFRATVNPARVQYAGYRESANQQHRTDEKNANIDRTYTEGNDAVTAAGNRAAAEATYQMALANQHQSAYEAIATTSGATGQQVFDYQRSVAEVGWINGLTTAYVQHARNVAYAEEYWRPYMEAKNPAAVESDPSATPLWVGAEIGREETQALYSESYAGTELAQELARSGAHAGDSATLNLDIVKAATKNAVDIAKADKKFAVTRAEQSGASSGSALDQADWNHKLEVAQAALAYTTGVEDAKLTFQHKETNSRQGYSQILASAQKTRDTTLAGAAKSTAITEAGYQANADYYFAVGEENDWKNETTFDNAVAAQKATADLALWTAEESANITAVQALDTVYSRPWTGFLVAQAQTHKDWWGSANQPNSMSAKYIQWTADRNNAESMWQTQTNTAHHQESATITIAENAAANKTAGALAALEIAKANADYDYLATPTTGAIAAGKTYDDSLAQSERDKAVNLAKAALDRAAAIANDEDASQADEEQEQANDEYGDAVQAANQLYDSRMAQASAGRGTAYATANFTDDSAIAASVRGRKTAIADAALGFEASSATHYVGLVAADALLDKAYTLLKSASLKSMAQGLAAIVSPSPWANYYAAAAAAETMRRQTNATALATMKIEVARADAGIDANGTPTGSGIVAVYADEYQALDAAALADEQTQTGVANLEFAVGLADASILGNDTSSLDRPPLESTPAPMSPPSFNTCDMDLSSAWPLRCRYSYVYASDGRYDYLGCYYGWSAYGVSYGSNYNPLAYTFGLNYAPAYGSSPYWLSSACIGEQASQITAEVESASAAIAASFEFGIAALPAPPQPLSGQAIESLVDEAIVETSQRRAELADRVSEDHEAIAASSTTVPSSPSAAEAIGVDDDSLDSWPEPSSKAAADDAVASHSEAATNADDGHDASRSSEDLTDEQKQVLEEIQALNRHVFEKAWKAYTSDREIKRIIDQALERRMLTVDDVYRIVLLPEEARRIALEPSPELTSFNPNNIIRDSRVLGVSTYSANELKAMGVPQNQIDWWTERGYKLSVPETLGAMGLDPNTTLFEPTAYSVPDGGDAVPGVILTDLRTNNQWLGLPQLSYTYKNGYDPGKDKPVFAFRSGPDPKKVEANRTGVAEIGWLFFNKWSDVEYNLSGKLRIEYAQLAMQLYFAFAGGIGALRGVNELGAETGAARFRGLSRERIEGGSYKSVREANIGGDVHHIPADSASLLPRDEGPAIYMDTVDHARTASFGNTKAARAYRSQQSDLVSQGRWMEAIQMDIDDIHRLFGKKYDDGIRQMLRYARWKELIK